MEKLPQKSNNNSNPTHLAEVVDLIVNKDHAFNFDFTMELAMPRMRVGTLRVHGKVESLGTKMSR